MAVDIKAEELCEDCPPTGYPNADIDRCDNCPRLASWFKARFQDKYCEAAIAASAQRCRDIPMDELEALLRSDWTESRVNDGP